MVQQIEDMKTPEEFAYKNNPSMFFDLEMSLNDWRIITEWVKNYSEYYHKEMSKQDNICRCSDCKPSKRLL